MDTAKFNTLADFLKVFKDEDTCRKYFEAIRFQKGTYCPHCAHREIYRFEDGKGYRCAKCKKDFTIKTGTVFGESKIPLQKWFIGIYLLSVNKKGVSSIQLSKEVGVTQKTAWFMDHRIRHALKENNGKLFGTVEIDETYMGGKEKNKHRSKRIKGTQGRNTLNKTAVMGLFQRGGNMKGEIVGDVSRATLESKIVNNVKFGTTLYTDDFLSYGRLGKFYPHEVVRHGRGEYVRNGDIHSNGAESFWALFKRGYHGIYHKMSKQHLQRYVDEFSYRYNNRKEPIDFVFSDVVNKVSQKQSLPYKTLTGAI